MKWRTKNLQEPSCDQRPGGLPYWLSLVRAALGDAECGYGLGARGSVRPEESRRVRFLRWAAESGEGV